MPRIAPPLGSLRPMPTGAGRRRRARAATHWRGRVVRMRKAAAVRGRRWRATARCRPPEKRRARATDARRCRRPFPDAANGSQPFHRILQPAIRVEQVRVGDRGRSDRGERRRTAARHAERCQVRGGERRGARKHMRELRVRRGEALTVHGDEARRQRRRGNNRNLLPQHCPHRELKAIPCARHAQPGPRLDQRCQRRILRQVCGDSHRIGRQVEHAAQPRNDRRQGRELGKAHRRSQRVAGAALHCDGPVHAVQLHRSGVAVGADSFDSGNRAAAQKLASPPNHRAGDSAAAERSHPAVRPGSLGRSRAATRSAGGRTKRGRFR
jgi:hypothetical protein